MKAHSEAKTLPDPQPGDRGGVLGSGFGRRPGGRYFPVRQVLPLPLRVGIGIVLGVLAVIIVAVSLGFVTEKGDERSMDNDRKANSTLFTLFFLLMGALLVFGKDGRVYAVGQSELLVIFAVVCLAKDLVFLGYEKFGT